MAYRNGVPYGAFPGPNGNPAMMNNQNLHFGVSRFNNSSPWRPQQEQHSFNINRFMFPPHMVQRPEFGAGNVFGQEVYGGPHENFPFNSQQNNRGQQNLKGHQVNDQHFHGHQNNGQPFKGNSNSGKHFQSRPQSRQHFQGHQSNGQHFQGHQNSDQHFQGPAGRGRGFMKSVHGGQGSRGGVRGGYNNAQQNHSNKPKKKEKVDKRDLAENNVFFCDICDRGFKELDKYKEHTDNHTKCSFQDCPFIAAPKLVQLHMKMQHRSGLAKKVWSVESEEDVKKWREERRRNFPTADNVKRKQEEKAQKVTRGEVLETREYGKMRRGRFQKRHRGRGREKFKNYMQAKDNKNEDNTADGSDDDSAPEEVKIERSTVKDVDSSGVIGHQESSTDSAGKAATAKAVSSTTDGSGAVTSCVESQSVNSSGHSLSLLASYGESSDDEGVAKKYSEACLTVSDVSAKTSNVMTVNEPSSTHAKTESLHDPLSPTSSFAVEHPQTSLSLAAGDDFSNNSHSAAADTICSPHKVESCTGVAVTSTDKQDSCQTLSCNNQEKNYDKNSKKVTHTNDASSDQKEKQHRGKRGPQSKQEGGPLAKKNKKGPVKQPLQRYTLLQKLLAPDIRKERNKILQCVHYIVKNKFFQ